MIISKLQLAASASVLLLSHETSAFMSPPSTLISMRYVPKELLKLRAMERLHDPSANPFGPLEHVYSLDDINAITHKIDDDEWMALGSAIAEAMLETILDISSDVLKAMGREERARTKERMAKDISGAVEETLNKIRFQPLVHEQGPHPLPSEIILPLQAILRDELQTLLQDQDDFLKEKEHDIYLLALSSISEAIESYCGITNINAPFFNLTTEMYHRVRDRRRELLIKHSKGFEDVSDVERDIEESRKKWIRVVLGRNAANDYKVGEVHHVMTKLGNASKEEQKQKNRDARAKFLSGLFRDLNGVLLP